MRTPNFQRLFQRPRVRGSRRSSWHIRLTLILGTIPVIGAPGWAEVGAPEAVSPGSERRFSAIESRCPTFSWSAVEGAEGYELVALEAESTRVPGEATGEGPALRVALPGTALSWTPALHRCLEPGRRYAWSVRTRSAAGGVTGPWSDPRLFAVVPEPTTEEVRRALAATRAGQGLSDPAHQGAGPVGPGVSETTGEGKTGKPRKRRLEPLPDSIRKGVPQLALSSADVTGIRAKSSPTPGIAFGVHGLSNSTGTGSAGVVGQSTATAGATAGVIGQVASAGGTAGLFDNTAGGPILRGLSSGVEVFSVAGTGGVSATSFSGDGSGLTGVNASTLGSSPPSAFAAAAHLHDDRYFTEAEMATSGGGGSVHWSNLVSVPPGFADGGDADTTYTAGAGLDLSGTRFGIRSSRVFTPGNTTTITLGDTSRASLTMGSDGLGLLGYASLSTGEHTLAHCDDDVCSSVTTTTLTTGSGSMFLTIGSDGLPLIVSNGPTVTHCDDAVCSSGTTTALGISGAGPVTIAADGLGLIAYRDSTSLKVAHCDNLACTSASISTLDSVFEFDTPSIALGADGLGLVSYMAFTADGLKAAHCDNVACSSATIATLDSGSGVGFHSSVAIGADGLGVISYLRQSSGLLMVAHCDDTDCASTTTSSVQAGCTTTGAESTALMIGNDGLALIAYTCMPFGSNPPAVRVAHCANVLCSSATRIILDPTAQRPAWVQLAIGADGLGLISYRDQDFPDTVLRVVHCGNSFCLPYFRRR